MITRQRLVTYGIPTAAAATIVAAALFTLASKDDSKPVASPGVIEPMQDNPVAKDVTAVDVVFALDTTGSMSGLLDGAKRTVWSIATHIRDTDPNADLRIGLVAYKDNDPSSTYVTKPFSLTQDLDAVYTELATYTASGGGDHPENVDAALYAALNMQWRPEAKKLIFVVGDAPPASRGDVPKFTDLAREATEKNIIVNTIRAGTYADTAVAFQKLASLGNGTFSTIEQTGGVQQVVTPYDDKLAELSAGIDSSAIIVGDEGVRRRHMGKMAAAAAAPAPAKADRAAYYAKAKRPEARAAEDLVGGVEAGTMSIDAVDEAKLPADLRGKDKAELEAEVEKRIAERKKAQQEIAKLTKERDEYLKKNAKGAGAAFDASVKATLDAQLKKK